MKGLAAVLSPLLLIVVLFPVLLASNKPSTSCGVAGSGDPNIDSANLPTISGYSASQVKYAALIIAVGKRDGLPQRGWLIAIMAALTESGLANLDHGDADSVGLFQQRPSAGWGTRAQLMNPEYAIEAFYGKLPQQGSGGTPAGLTQILGWEALSAGAAAQSVEVSANPDSYQAHEGAAAALIAQLVTKIANLDTDAAITQPGPSSRPADPSGGVGPGGCGDTGGACGWVNPVPPGWSVGATFHQKGSWTWMGWHTGYDFDEPVGSPVYAAAAGTVSEVNPAAHDQNGSAWGNQIVIDHGQMPTNHGTRYVSSTYNHLRDFAVAKGDQVQAGQLIGHVGMTGNTTGPHLHFEIHDSVGPTFNWATPAADDFEDPWAWLNSHRDGSGSCMSGDGAAGPLADKAIAAAKTELGIPYSLGGGTATGPTVGATRPAGWDCSSFVQMAYYRASAGKILLPRTTYQQMGSSLVEPVSMAHLAPGDLIFVQTGAEPGFGHVVMYVGNGKIVEEPRTGEVSRIMPLSEYRGMTQAARRVKG